LCSMCYAITKNPCTSCKNQLAIKEGYCQECFNKKNGIKYYTTEEDIKELYNQYIIETKIICKILSKNEMISLTNILKDKTPEEMYATFMGFRDFPAIALLARQADILLTNAFEKCADSDKWRYIHAICLFTIDPWNLENKDGTLLCYWKNFGELKNPKLGEKIKKYFNLDYGVCMSSFGLSNIKIYDCPICLEEQNSRDDLVQCRVCRKICHMKCAIEYWETSGKHRICVNCREKGVDTAYANGKKITIN
jgi:hypothetical protein